jgi:hypothetical protein
MQDLDWNDLHYILCLSRTGRIVGAARKLASAISPPQVYKILWKELNEEEGRWQVMPAEKKPHRASSAALAHLDELLDEALEQTFPASDAFHSSASWRRGSLCNEKSLHHRSAIEAKGVCKNWFRASLPAVLASSQEAN